MVQAVVTTQWLLDGFKYDLGSTRNPQTLTYYCGHIQRFLNWAEVTGVPKEAHLIDKRHIQAFFYHLWHCTKASFVICDNLAGLSLPTGLGVAIKNGRAITSSMRDY